ncbi:CPBP family glutamic-type intramembrane protease [Bacillus canaveralius]|uniref:CPBP family glutamic-type intramembrane protease n=1 Tax=Bacillus canaveralius TaxID=1403243 RepID=UPI0035E3C3C1
MMGFLMGYLFYKTSNLWICIVWHTVWNSCLNVLTIQSAALANDSGLISISTNFFWVAFKIAVIVSMLLIRISSNVVTKTSLQSES